MTAGSTATAAEPAATAGGPPEETNPWGTPAGVQPAAGATGAGAEPTAVQTAAPRTEVLNETDLDRAFQSGAATTPRGARRDGRRLALLAGAAVAVLLIVILAVSSAGGHSGGGSTSTTVPASGRLPTPLPAPTVGGRTGPDLGALHKAVNP